MNAEKPLTSSEGLYTPTPSARQYAEQPQKVFHMVCARGDVCELGMVDQLIEQFFYCLAY